jgi:hypothetical protein
LSIEKASRIFVLHSTNKVHIKRVNGIIYAVVDGLGNKLSKAAIPEEFQKND